MKIAIIQDGPVYLNIEKTVEKTCEYLLRAYEQKVDLVVFGENWMTGYPIWLDICADINLWDYEPVKQVWSRMYDNAISLESKAMAAIQKVIKELGLYVIMGANEIVGKGKGNNTIYNSIFTFGRDGSIVNHHRKLMPTYTEKLVHGLGDGYGLNTIDTDFGRLGSLICWEHWMPLTRQAMHDEGEDIHIALWPYAKEMHQVASRHYAFEGRCTTVAVGQIMAVEELPKELTLSKEIRLDEDGLIMKGGAAIYAPNGDVILAPQYGNREMIVQELNLSINRGEHMNLSVSGHYQRPDVFSYHVNKKRLGVEK